LNPDPSEDAKLFEDLSSEIIEIGIDANSYIFGENGPINWIDFFGLGGLIPDDPGIILPSRPLPWQNWLPPYPVGPVSIDIRPPNLIASCPIGVGWTETVRGNPFTGSVSGTASHPFLHGTLGFTIGNNGGRGGVNGGFGWRGSF
jgi:hypothetical protein